MKDNMDVSGSSKSRYNPEIQTSTKSAKKILGHHVHDLSSRAKEMKDTVSQQFAHLGESIRDKVDLSLSGSKQPLAKKSDLLDAKREIDKKLKSLDLNAPNMSQKKYLAELKSLKEEKSAIEKSLQALKEK